MAGKIKQILETATNIGVIVGVIFVGILLYRSHAPGPGLSLKKGDRLPQLPDYAWSSSPRTLILAVRDGCHFCEESAPFYQKLAELKKEGRINASLLMVYPPRAEKKPPLPSLA
jgi:hypothetical protein